MTILHRHQRLSLLAFIVILLQACTAEFFPPAFQFCPVTRGGDLTKHVIGSSAGSSDWPSWGGDLQNSHHGASETTISPANVANLETKWIFNSSGSISANPTITDNDLYITDWGPGVSISANFPGGKVYSIDKNTGAANWSKSVRALNGNDRLNTISRSSPAIFEDLIIIADVQNPAPIIVNPSLIQRAVRFLFDFDDICGGYLYALNRSSGDLVWSRRLGTQEFDQISQSPIVHNEQIFVGVSSHESTYARSAEVPCCKFRGSFLSIDAHTGNINWRRYMINDTEDFDQFSGAAVWAGAPTIDPARNAVYVPTGNNYSVPQAVQNCILLADGNSAQIDLCLAGQPDNFFDSIVSLDMTTGNVNWATKSQQYDAWTTACDFEKLFPLLASSSSRKNCPNPAGPDSDFAQPPMLINVAGQDRLFAGNKSGEFFSINPDDGSIVWRRQLGPGGLIGGMQFGAASDGTRLYVQNTNYDHTPYTLEAGSLTGTTVRSGFWSALDPATGNVLWQTPVPGYAQEIEAGGAEATGTASSNSSSTQITFSFSFNSGGFHPVSGFGLGPGFFNWAMGGLTVANGVVYAGVANLQGTMVAMDASNGTILWQFDTGQSIVSAPSVVDGRVYWGSGYKTGTQGNRLYSFGLP